MNSIGRKLLIAASQPKDSLLAKMFHAEALADLEAATRAPQPGERGAAAYLFCLANSKTQSKGNAK